MQKTDYEKGTAYAQVAISTKDVYKTADQIKAAGGKVVREPGPVPGIGTKVGTSCFFQFFLVELQYCYLFSFVKRSHMVIYL